MSINLVYDPAYADLTKQFLELKTAFAAYYQVDPSLVIPTNGATGALDAIFSHVAATNHVRASAVLSSMEYFDAVKMLHIFDIAVHAVPCNGIRYSTEKVIELLQTTRPALFYVSIPNNPTGSLLPEEDLSRIITSASDYTRIVIDRALIGAPDFCSPATLQRLYGETKDLVLVNSFSKTHGLVKERIGSIVALKPSTASSIHPFAHATNAYGMEKTITCLGNTTFADQLRQKIKDSHHVLMDWNQSQNKAVYHPSNSNFACIELRNISGSTCKARLQEQNVHIRAGADLFIDEKFIRIDMGQPEVLPEFLAILDRVLTKERLFSK